MCGGDYLTSLSQTLFELGTMLGQLSTSLLIDRFGRSRSHTVSIILVMVIGSVLAFAPSYVAFVALRTVIAFVLAVSITYSTLLWLCYH